MLSGSRIGKRLAVLLVVAAQMMSGTAWALDLPDIGESAGAVISPAQEHRIGQSFLRHLRKQGEVLDDPQVEAYIQSLGYRLVSHSDDNTQHFTFFVVKDSTVNAFATPGAYVGVDTGLILTTDTESELAAVMAHECSHVTQHHMARMFEKASQMSLPMAAAMIGAILLGTQDSQAGMAAMAGVTAGGMQAQLNFTRANEEEADRVGMRLLAASGFDPRAMPKFFEKLQVATRFDQGNLPEFLRTHPVTTARIADARNRAAQYPTVHLPKSVPYELMKARVRALYAGSPDDAIRYFESMLRDGTYKNENAARYGYALALMRNDEFGKARLQIQHLLASDPDRVTYKLAAAKLEVDADKVQAGIKIYKDALKLYPDYRPLVFGYAQALLDGNQPKEARDVLRDYAIDHHVGAPFYRLQAQAEGGSGNKIEAHISMAEYYYLSGETKIAIQQLRLAKTDPRIDDYQRQRVTARLAQLEKEYKEEKKMKKEGHL